MSLPFSLPPTTPQGITPIWRGDGFQIGQDYCSILQYSENNQGWNDELTSLHEESVGDQHFIDCASRDHAIQQLQKHVLQAHPTLLEIGCSSGYLLKRITQSFQNALVMGADVVSEPLKKLAILLPNVPLFRFDLTHCPLPENSVDAVVILNVLEHIQDDATALKQIYRILKPGGVVIIEVPAGPDLYDVYDQVLMHYRRYTLSHLSKLVSDQGFHITQQSHLGFFLFPGFWWVKKRNKRLLKAPEDVQNKWVENSIRQTGESKILHTIMQTELLLGRYFSFPVGIRCLVTAKKMGG